LNGGLWGGDKKKRGERTRNTKMLLLGGGFNYLQIVTQGVLKPTHAEARDDYNN